MQSNEIFVPILDFYEISNNGIIRSRERITTCPLNGVRKKKAKVMKPRFDKDGYLRISLYSNGKQKNLIVHRLIAETFIPNPENKPFVNHKNGIKNDNRIENLEWCTQSENEIHAIKYLGKKQPKGEQSRLSKKIIAIHPDGKEELIYGLCEAERRLNVHHSNITSVLRGKYSQCNGYKFRYA